MYYLIQETLTPCTEKEICQNGVQYAAVLTAQEWQTQRNSFDMLIDMEIDMPRETKALVNQDFAHRHTMHSGPGRYRRYL